MKNYDVIVIGLGGIGSAAVYHLAKSGASVLGIDRFNPPHNHGSSHGETRAIRLAYFEHPDYVPLLKRAYALWDDLETETGEKLFEKSGILQMGPPDGEVIQGVLRAAQEHKLEIQEHTATEIEKNFSGLRVPDYLVGVFEKNAGFLKVEECISQHLHLAQKNGATLKTDEEVITWTHDNDFTVQTKNNSFTCQKLIITAGAWANSLMQENNIPLTVLRKPLFWFDTDHQDYNLSSGFPTFFYELPEGMFYGFPKVNEHGVKIAEHTGGKIITNPLTISDEVDPVELERINNFSQQHLLKTNPKMSKHAVCFYTMTSDGHFVVDEIKSHKFLYTVAGLSGHGFKFSSVLGEILSDLTTEGKTELPISFLSSSRFLN